MMRAARALGCKNVVICLLWVELEETSKIRTPRCPVAAMVVTVPGAWSKAPRLVLLSAMAVEAGCP